MITIAKRSKYNVDQSKKGKQNRTCDNILFDSILEMQYYKEVVCVGLKNGSIKKYDRQIKYELQPKYKYNNNTILSINYVADFVITYADDSVIIIDVKGLPDSTAKIKKKMFHYKYPDINYIWMGRSIQDGGWLEFKELEKKRKERKKAKSK